MADRDVASAPPEIRADDDDDNSISTGALVAVIIVGSAVVFAGLAYFFIWLRRRRAARHGGRQEEDLDADRDKNASQKTGTRVTARKLGKKSWTTTFKSREPSPPRSDSLPAVSPAFRQPSLIFHGTPPSEHKKGVRVRESSWVDEDVLHGPRPMKQKETKQRSIRDSWPLKNMVPTPPGSNGTHQPQHQHQRQSHHQQNALAIGSAHVQPLQVRKLPQPPLPVATPGGRQPANSGNAKQYQEPEDARRQRTAANANPAGTGTISPQHSRRRRQSSTDSTLSEILKLTERRLQASAMTGAKANRSAVSLPMTPGDSRETLVARGGVATDGSTLCQSRSQSRTPSPTKASAAHQRKLSESSVISETDSILSNGPTSPSKAARARDVERQMHEAQSPSSSISSALSTLYSEDEAQESNKVTSTLDSAVLASTNSVQLAHAYSLVDPFLPPTIPPKSSIRPGSQTRQQMRPVQNIDNASTLGTRVFNQNSGPSAAGHNPRFHPSSRDTIRLVDSTSSTSLHRLVPLHSHQSTPPIKNHHPPAVTVLPPTLPTSGATRNSAYPNPNHKPGMIVHRSIPSTERSPFVTSTSAASMLSPALSDMSFLQSYIQVGSPSHRQASRTYSLRPQASSPTLGLHGQGNRDIIPPLPPVPAAYAAARRDSRQGYAAAEPPPSPTRQPRDSRSRRPGSRVISTSSSTYSPAPPARDGSSATVAARRSSGQQPHGSSGLGARRTAPVSGPRPQSSRMRRSLSVDSTHLTAANGSAGTYAAITRNNSNSANSNMNTNANINNNRNSNINSKRNSATIVTSRSRSLNRSSVGGVVDGGGDGAPVGLASAIAQLRRMNSAASTYSIGSTYSTAAVAAPTSATAAAGAQAEGSSPMVRAGTFGRTQRGVGAGAGTRNYLSLDGRGAGGGSTNGGGGGGKAAVRGTGRRVGGGGGGGTEAAAGNGGDSRKVLQQVRGLEGGRGSPTKASQGLREGSDGNRRTPSRRNSARSFEKLGRGCYDRNMSQDSLGLYDKEGFLISTPVRDGASPNRPSGLRA